MLDTETEEAPASTGRRPWKGIAVGAILVLAAAGAAVFWFFSGDAPDRGRPRRDGGCGDGRPSTTAGEAPAAIAEGIEGSWTVDTSVGEFSVTENTTATFVGFRIEEELANIGSATAVGRTPGVSGSMVIEGTTLTFGRVHRRRSPPSSATSRAVTAASRKPSAPTPTPRRPSCSPSRSTSGRPPPTASRCTVDGHRRPHHQRCHQPGRDPVGGAARRRDDPGGRVHRHRLRRLRRGGPDRTDGAVGRGPRCPRGAVVALQMT